jgi:hypothetical protein
LVRPSPISFRTLRWRGSALLAGRACRRCLPAGPSACSPRGDPAAAGRTRRADRAGQTGPADLTAVPAKVLDRAARRARAARASGLARQAFRPCKGRGGQRSAGFAARRRSPPGPPRIHLNLSSSPADEDPVSRRDQAGRDRHIQRQGLPSHGTRSVHRTRRD